MGRPTKEQAAAKAALSETTGEQPVSPLNVPLVGIWFNVEEQRFETILAKCDPVTGEAKVESTKNAGVITEQAFNNFQKLVVEQRINKGLR